MSTRYVWGKYNYGYVYLTYMNHNSVYVGSTLYYNYTCATTFCDSKYQYGANEYIRIVVCNNFKLDKTIDVITPLDIVYDVSATIADNNYRTVFGTEQRTPEGRFLFYFTGSGPNTECGYFVKSPDYTVAESSTSPIEPSRFVEVSIPSVYTIGTWKPASITGMYNIVCTPDEADTHTSNESNPLDYPLVKQIQTTLTRDKTDLVSFVTNATSGYYPSNGVSSSYWYYYQGADSIDPSSIEITTSNLEVGKSCTIQITAGTGKKYEGTISYVIQYSINNGESWNTLATTTSTSYTFALSGDMSQLKVRTYAKDNLGFTSSTYVTSTNYSVSNYKCYTSISGAIKGVNPVVAVGGGGTFRKGCCLQRRSYQDSVNHYNYACLVDIA